MPSRLQHRIESQQPQGIDISPLLDVVFILLIFFIVTTVFVKETGVDVDKPQAISAERMQRDMLLLAISAQGEVFYDGANIGVAGVRPIIEQVQMIEPRPVVIQADRSVSAQLLLEVIDQAKLAGAESVNLAAVKP